MNRRGAIRTIGAGVAGLVIGAAAGYELGAFSAAPAPAVSSSSSSTTTTQQLQSLTATTWGGPWGDALKATIPKARQDLGVDLTVDLYAGGSAPTLVKLEQSLDPNNPLTDLFWGDGKYALEGIGATGKTKVFTAIDETNLPNVQAIPKQFKTYYNNQLICVGMYPWNITFAYRTDLVKNPPTSWADLFNPDFKGKIALPYSTIFSGLVVVAAAYANGGSLQNTDPGFALLQKLAQAGQIGNVFQSDADSIRLLQTGDATLVFTFTSDSYSAVTSSAPIAPILSMKDSITPVGFDGISLVDGKNKDLAATYLNWFMGPDILQDYAVAVGEVPTNPNALVSPKLSPWYLPLDQIAAQPTNGQGYVSDPLILAQSVDKWASQWDTMVTPYIK